MDLSSLLPLVVLALSAAAAFVVWKQLQGQKPDAADIFATGTASKRKPKRKPEPKKQEVFKWDAPAEEEKKTEGSPTGKKKKAYDPIAAGAAMVASGIAEAKDDVKKELTERQKNKLQAQGFVTTAAKPKGGKRDSSPSHDASDDDHDEYAGMSHEAAERLKLLERIASGKRATPDEYGDRDKKKQASTLGQERRIDHSIVAEKLAKEKQERADAMKAKTQVMGGKVAFRGAGVTIEKAPKQSAWARSGSPGSADAAEPATEEAAAEAAAEEDAPQDPPEDAEEEQE